MKLTNFGFFFGSFNGGVRLESRGSEGKWAATITQIRQMMAEQNREESHQGNGGNYEASGAGKTREFQTDDDDWILGLPKFIGTCFTGNNNHPPLSQTQKTHDLL